MEEYKFRVEFLEDAKQFLDALDEKARVKIYYNIWKARITDDKELFKKLQNEIWEFRTMYSKIHYRLFAFWDKTDEQDTLVISTHGLIKKTGKTPKGEIEKAERLMVQYFNEKGRKK
ncbi:MAG: type II toxin-antitoxin system RelE/ParE family toxin [Bacteroidetes bacterium]|nr:type II toxin-antitoxin system RelE/ParE family toxin [Bacteroidota bacterium]